MFRTWDKLKGAQKACARWTMKIPGWLEENQPVAGGTNSAIIQPQLGRSGAKISGRENLNLFYFPLIGLVWRNLGLPVFFLALTCDQGISVLKIKQFQLHNFIKTCEHFMYSQHCQSASRASWKILLLCVLIVLCISCCWLHRHKPVGGNPIFDRAKKDPRAKIDSVP